MNPQPPETIAQLAKRVGRTTMTVWRWIHTGVTVGSAVVKLNARRIGGRWAISREAWDQFERDTNPEAPKLPDSPAAESRRVAAARRELAALLK